MNNANVRAAADFATFILAHLILLNCSKLRHYRRKVFGNLAPRFACSDRQDAVAFAQNGRRRGDNNFAVANDATISTVPSPEVLYQDWCPT
jgi:hypothetical protein